MKRSKRKPPVSDYGMNAKCRTIRWLTANPEDQSTASGRATIKRALDLLLAVEWCRANECEFDSWRLRNTRRWGYIVRNTHPIKPWHSEAAATPMAAVRQMQKWMRDNGKVKV